MNETERKIFQWTHAHTRTSIGALVGIALVVFLFVHETHNKGQDIAELKTFIAQHDADQARKDAASEAKIAALQARNEAIEQDKQSLKQQPSLAPQIIEKYIPFTLPLQQTAPITKGTPPNAPSAIITNQQEQELATFAASCRQCKNDNQAKDAKITELTGQNKTLERERNEAIKTAKGGSIFKRVARIGLMAGCGAGGAILGSKVPNQSSPAPGAATGAVIGVVTCSLISH